MQNVIYNLSELNLVTFPTLLIGLAGVYIWTNTTNNKCYVGSSNNLARRVGEYLNPKRLAAELARGESIIYKAMLKYGYSAFSFQVLKIVPTNHLTSDEEKSKVLEEAEQVYLDELKPEYNIRLTAGSNLGAKMSDETRVKMSAAKKGKPSHRKGQKLSDETRERMRLSNSNAKTVYMYSSDDVLLQTFVSMSECSREMGFTRDEIRRSMLTRFPVHPGGCYFSSVLSNSLFSPLFLTSFVEGGKKNQREEGEGLMMDL